MIEQNVSTLKIHRLTQEQYDRELAAGRIDENAIYLTPEEELDLSDYATLDQLKNKVDKVSGKDLSTNDYTTAEKNKLANIEEGAQVNQNAFAKIYVNGQSKPAVSPDSSIEVKPGVGISVGAEAGNNATYDLKISNTGVLEIASGTVNGTISVTKHNTTTNVAVKGLGSAAYTAASAYDAAGAADEALESAKDYTDTSIANLVNSAPETLDTLGEIADALAENEDIVDALNQAIGNKANKSDLPEVATDDDVLDLLIETNIIEPIYSNNNEIFTDSEGNILCL